MQGERCDTISLRGSFFSLTYQLETIDPRLDFSLKNNKNRAKRPSRSHLNSQARG